MKSFEHILCPIDFSDPSHQSLGLAEQLARDLQAELTVLHVIDSRLPSLGNLYPLQDAFRELRRRAELEMAGWKESAKLPRAQWEVVEGIPHRVIVDRSKQGDVDLLIMARHGYSGLERLLLGSVTEKVLHQIEIPILVVGPSGENGGYEPFVKKAFRTILVAVDLGPDSAPSIDYASVIARQYGSNLLAVHVMSPLADVLGGPMWPAAPELMRLSQDVKTKRLEELQKLSRASAGLKIEPLLWEGDPAGSILQVAAEREADLLVMGAQGHARTKLGWLGSTSHKVIRGAPCPVLAVRRNIRVQ